MIKQLGIARNRTQQLNSIKREATRKKNRFQMVGKQHQQFDNGSASRQSYSLTTNNSDPISFGQIKSTQSFQQSSQVMKLFEQARKYLKQTAQIQKKMGQLSKARLTCLRQKENQKNDQKISKLASQATHTLLNSQKCLKQIANIKANSSLEQKMYKSMERQLASQIQEASRSLRQQEQEYFKMIKSYEGSTVNSAIQLTVEQRRAMEGEWEQLQEKPQEDSKVGELVSSITRLSALYKQLNQMVVAQGTVIDRIDYNLQATQEHTKKAVVHLQGADAAASSAFADKVIKMLVISIIFMAVILGVKYMK